MRQQKIKKITSLFPNLRDSFDLENKLAKPQKNGKRQKVAKVPQVISSFIYLLFLCYVFLLILYDACFLSFVLIRNN